MGFLLVESQGRDSFHTPSDLKDWHCYHCDVDIFYSTNRNKVRNRIIAIIFCFWLVDRVKECSSFKWRTKPSLGFMSNRYCCCGNCSSLSCFKNHTIRRRWSNSPRWVLHQNSKRYDVDFDRNDVTVGFWYCNRVLDLVQTETHPIIGNKFYYEQQIKRDLQGRWLSLLNT